MIEYQTFIEAAGSQAGSGEACGALEAVVATVALPLDETVGAACPVVDVPDPTPGEGQQPFEVNAADTNVADAHHSMS